MLDFITLLVNSIIFILLAIYAAMLYCVLAKKILPTKEAEKSMRYAIIILSIIIFSGLVFNALSQAISCSGNILFLVACCILWISNIILQYVVVYDLGK